MRTDDSIHGALHILRGLQSEVFKEWRRHPVDHDRGQGFYKLAHAIVYLLSPDDYKPGGTVTC